MGASPMRSSLERLVHGRGAHATIFQLRVRDVCSCCCLREFFSPKLAARGVDVAAAAFADVGVDAVVSQDRLERHDIFALRPAIRKRGDFVVTNQVDVRAQRLADLRELPRVLRPIVHAREQDVFQRDLAASLLEVIPRGREDLID